MKLKILAVVVLGAVGVGATLYSAGLLVPSTAASTQFLTSAAAAGNITETVAATGTLAPQVRFGLVFGSDPYIAGDSTVAPNGSTTWPVSEVNVDIGDTVKQGDVLASADTTTLRADLASARNSLLSAQVALRAAQASLSDARDGDVASQIRQAKIGLYNAENQLAEATRSVSDIESEIDLATLASPIDGLVTEINIAAGFDAPSGAAIVVDSATFEITTDVVESDLVDVIIGQSASITVSATGSSLNGTITSISPIAGSTSGSGVVTYPVTITIQDAPSTLRSGMSADVTITIASVTNVLTVPAEALNGTTGDYSVRLLGADGTATVQPVEVGLVTASLAEIKSGLTAGQMVITGVNTTQNGTTTNVGGPGGGVAIPGGGFGGGGPGGGQGPNGGQP